MIFQLANENPAENEVDELISFDSDHPTSAHLPSSSDVQSQAVNVRNAILNRTLRRPSPHSSRCSAKVPLIHSISPLPPPHQPALRQVIIHFRSPLKSHPLPLILIDGKNLFTVDPHPPSSNATLFTDPFGIPIAPTYPSNSPLNSFRSNSATNGLHNNSSPFNFQPPPAAQFVPSRPAPPIPTLSMPQTFAQRPLTLQTLSLNPIRNASGVVTDLLDLGDPGSPPPSPKFDPYG